MEEIQQHPEHASFDLRGRVIAQSFWTELEKISGVLDVGKSVAARRLREGTSAYYVEALRRMGKQKVPPGASRLSELSRFHGVPLGKLMKRSPRASGLRPETRRELIRRRIGAPLPPQEPAATSYWSRMSPRQRMAAVGGGSLAVGGVGGVAGVKYLQHRKQDPYRSYY